MYSIIFFSLLVIFGSKYLWKKEKKKDKYMAFDDFVFETKSLPILGLIVFLAIISLSLEGFVPNYSNGERMGYITKSSTKGLIFKTHEAEIQLGTGAQASLQAAYSFSIIDKSIINRINELQKHKVRVVYTEWLILPVYLGETNYLAKKIEIVKDN